MSIRLFHQIRFGKIIGKSCLENVNSSAIPCKIQGNNIMHNTSLTKKYSSVKEKRLDCFYSNFYFMNFAYFVVVLCNFEGAVFLQTQNRLCTLELDKVR